MFARDELPEKTMKGEHLIANLDGSEGGGTHWVVMHHDESTDMFEYFDGFGLPGFVEALEYFSNGNSVNYRWNSTQYQEKSSVLCGYYCLWWCWARARHNRFFDTLEDFIKHSFENI